MFKACFTVIEHKSTMFNKSQIDFWKTQDDKRFQSDLLFLKQRSISFSNSVSFKSILIFLFPWVAIKAF